MCGTKLVRSEIMIGRRRERRRRKRDAGEEPQQPLAFTFSLRPPLCEHRISFAPFLLTSSSPSLTQSPGYIL